VHSSSLYFSQFCIFSGHTQADDSWRIIKGTKYQPGGFDGATQMNYRLGNFLRHNLVPDSVTSSLSPVYCIGEPPGNDGSVVVRIPSHPEGGVSVRDVLDWFAADTSSVLRIQPMLHLQSRLSYYKVLSLDLFNILVHKTLEPDQ
jgi:hypothetical protein